jgi:hypothetical protein
VEVECGGMTLSSTVVVLPKQDKLLQAADIPYRFSLGFCFDDVLANWWPIFGGGDIEEVRKMISLSSMLGGISIQLASLLLPLLFLLIVAFAPRTRFSGAAEYDSCGTVFEVLQWTSFFWI